MTPLRARLAALALTVFSAGASWSATLELAKYAEAYNGPKTLTVERVATADGTQALIKVQGINHPWNDKVVLTRLRPGAQGRTEYVAKVQGKDYVVMNESEQGGASLFLPGQADLWLSFDKPASKALSPQRLLSDYERADGAVK